MLQIEVAFLVTLLVIPRHANSAGHATCYLLKERNQKKSSPSSSFPSISLRFLFLLLLHFLFFFSIVLLSFLLFLLLLLILLFLFLLLCVVCRWFVVVVIRCLSWSFCLLRLSVQVGRESIGRGRHSKGKFAIARAIGTTVAPLTFVIDLRSDKTKKSSVENILKEVTGTSLQRDWNTSERDRDTVARPSQPKLQCDYRMTRTPLQHNRNTNKARPANHRNMTGTSSQHDLNTIKI